MPWLDVSLDTANRFYTWGWRGSIIGAVVTAISVIFLMWGTRIRDHEAELQTSRANFGLQQAEIRATSLEAATAQARIEQGKLRESNAQLQSEIDRIKRPRKISKEGAAQMTSVLRASGKHIFHVIYVAQEPDAESLAFS
jgi:hypothetical protein